MAPFEFEMCMMGDSFMCAMWGDMGLSAVGPVNASNLSDEIDALGGSYPQLVAFQQSLYMAPFEFEMCSQGDIFMCEMWAQMGFTTGIDAWMLTDELMQLGCSP